MRKQMFSKLQSSVMIIAGFALFIFVGKHVFATPNAAGGADDQTKEHASKSVISAASFEKSVIFQFEGEPEDRVFWHMGGPSAKIAAGANANAVLSLDLITDGGAGNGRDDGVTTGTVSGRGTTIAIEVFATGVRTSLRGVSLKFDFDPSLLTYVKAENSAFPLAIPDASVGTNLAATTPATLAASGFLARAEFETVANVTGREFSIGIESVTLAESSASQDELTTTSEIGFNATPSPDFDGDGTVGFSDFIAFASKFGTRRGEAAFDARFDMDGDGEAGFSDFIAFARQFGTTVGPPPPSGSPDLIIESPSVNDNTLTPGQSFTLGATVRNQGSASSPPTTLRYYRSPDATISTDDVEVGTDGVGSLSAGGASAESISLNAPSDAGTYYYGACVESVSGESNTGNNCSSARRVTVTQTTPSGFAPADQQAFNSLVVGNRIDAESYFIDFESAGRFKESFDRDEGSYTYSRTGANAGTFTQTYDEGLYGGRCVTSLTFTSTTTGTLSYTCGNNGTESEVESWQLSDLKTPILVRATADTLGFAFLDSWSAGQTRAYDFAVRRKTTSQGEWDSLCQTYSNSSDNSQTTYVTVALISSRFLPNTTYEMRYRYRNSSSCDTGSPGPWSPIAEATTPGSGTGGGGGASPDLIVESPTVDDNTLITGQPITFGATVRNRGNASSAATTLRYYRSDDATIDVSDSEVGTDGVGSLSAGGTSAESISLNAPSDAGAYYYGACVESVSGESNTGNNCSSGVNVTVTGSPDLIVESQTVDDNTLTTGQSFTFSATVRNQGTEQAAATTMRYYRSDDATIDASDTEVGTDDVSGLSAGDTSAESINLPAPSDAGTYYYGACVESVSGESNTGNNCSSGVSVTVTVSGGTTTPAPARWKLYWSEWGIESGKESIRRSNLDGSGIEDLVTAGLDAPGGIALDVSGGKMYWTDWDTDKIQRSNLDGSGVEDLVTGLTSPGGIALHVAGGKMYWTDGIEDKIQRSNLDGSGVEDVITGLDAPGSIALDVTGGKMYWTDAIADKIQRSNLDGSDVEDLVTSGLDVPGGIALDVAGGKMYWADRGEQGRDTEDKIQRSNLDGSGVEDLVTSGFWDPRSIALDVAGGKMYWTHSRARISRSNLDGSGVEDLFTGLDWPLGIALGLVPVVAGPDLAVTTSVDDNTLTLGQSFALSATVRNLGTEQTAATILRYYRSDDASIDATDAQFGTDAVNSLASLTTSDYSIALTAPTNTGTYYYGACVESVSGESNTGNNCSSPVTVTVRDADAVSTTISGCSGTNYIIQGYTDIYISGTVHAHKTVSELAIIGSYDGSQGRKYIGDLGAGQSETFRLTVRVPRSLFFINCSWAHVRAEFVSNGSAKVTAGEHGSSEQIRVQESVLGDRHESQSQER